MTAIGPARSVCALARRLAEGKTTGEIARILKRYVAREVFKHLPRTTRPSSSVGA